MPLSAGTVTINSSGDPSGGGMARALYEAGRSLKTDQANADCDAVEATGAEVPNRAEVVHATLEKFAQDCAVLATGLVPYLVDNAEIDGDPGHIT